jgi:NAD(P)H-dependent FMN reductase
MSHRVAAFFKNFLEANALAKVEMLDLKAYNFPIFEERLANLKDGAPVGLVEFSKRFIAADGILMVAPEYNGSYPPSLLNVVDVLVKEWYRKPVAIAAVSSGFGSGSRATVQLQSLLFKLQALCAPATFNVGFVEQSYDENGVPKDKEQAEKFAHAFIKELLFVVDAQELDATK